MLGLTVRDAEGSSFGGKIRYVLQVPDEFAWLQTLFGDLCKDLFFVVVVDDPTPVS